MLKISQPYWYGKNSRLREVSTRNLPSVGVLPHRPSQTFLEREILRVLVYLLLLEEFVAGGLLYSVKHVPNRPEVFRFGCG